MVQLSRRTGWTQAQIEQEFQRPIEYLQLVRERHGTMPFLEGHPHVEIQGPVGLSRHHAGLGPQISLALIHHHEVALRLARDVVEGLARQGRRIAESELLIDTATGD